MPKPMLSPDPALMAKLGSIAVHASEMLSADGHYYDRVALVQLLADPAVVRWLDLMDRAAMIPKKRK